MLRAVKILYCQHGLPYLHGGIIHEDVNAAKGIHCLRDNVPANN